MQMNYLSIARQDLRLGGGQAAQLWHENMYLVMGGKRTRMSYVRMFIEWLFPGPGQYWLATKRYCYRAHGGLRLFGTSPFVTWLWQWDVVFASHLSTNSRGVSPKCHATCSIPLTPICAKGVIHTSRVVH